MQVPCPKVFGCVNGAYNQHSRFIIMPRCSHDWTALSTHTVYSSEYQARLLAMTSTESQSCLLA